MRQGRLLALIVAVLLISYAVAAPYLTVERMKSAAQAQDSQALAAYIDSPRLRSSLKDQMNLRFAQQLQHSTNDSHGAFAHFSMALTSMMVDKVVDAYLSPTGLRTLMSGYRPALEFDSFGEDLKKPSPFQGAKMSYLSFSRFAVTLQEPEGKNTQFILRRSGLSWKLADIRLPSE